MTRLPVLIALTMTAAHPAIAAKPCLDQSEADAVMTVALPGIVTGMAEHCAGTLPATAFLPTRGEALAERYRKEGDAAWPRARTAVARIGGDLLEGMGEAGQRAALEGLVGEQVAIRISAENCAAADEMLALVEPLPAASVGQVATLLLTLVGESEAAENLPFTFCTQGTAE